MRAVQIQAWGDPEVLQIVELPEPEVGAGRVRLRVRRAGVNFVDTVQRRRDYLGALPPLVLGGEVVGEIDQLGDGVEGWQLGQRVVATTPGFLNGYAERVVVDAGAVVGVPDGVSDEDAAVVPVQGLTAAELLRYAPVGPGAVVLVHAAAGGVGSVLVQLARRAGATVVAAAGEDSKLELARALGAHHLVNYRTTGWTERVKDVSGGRGADVVYASAAGDVTRRSLAATAFGGQVVLYGARDRAETALGPDEIGQMWRRIRVSGYSIFDTPAEEARAIQRDLFDELARGTVRPLPGTAFGFEDAAEAHSRMEDRGTTGKITLAP